MRKKDLPLSIGERNGQVIGAWLLACSGRLMRVSVLSQGMNHNGLTRPDIPITSSDFWQDENECTEDVLRHVFRSCTDEEIPLFKERMGCLREAGKVLYEVLLPLLFLLLL